MRRGPGASPMREASQGKAKKNIGKRRSSPDASRAGAPCVETAQNQAQAPQANLEASGRRVFELAPGRLKRPLGAMILWLSGLPALLACFFDIKRDKEKKGRKRRKRQKGNGKAQEEKQDGSAAPWRCGAAHPGLGRAGPARLLRPRLGFALGKKKRERLIRRPLPATAKRRRPRTFRPRRTPPKQSSARAGDNRPAPSPWMFGGPKAPGPKGRGKPRLGRRAKLAALSQARRGAPMGWPGWSPAGCRLRRPLRSRRFLALRRRIRLGADSIRSRRGRLARRRFRPAPGRRRFEAAAAGC